MDTWIDLARGPLFRFALAVLVLGLGYRLAVTLAEAYRSWRLAGDRHLPGRAIAAATLQWIFPGRLMRTRPLYGVASGVFHAGILVVPPFLAGHVLLLSAYLPSWWPVLPAAGADLLSLVALVAAAGLTAGRAASRSSRSMSRSGDYAVPVVLFLLLGSGLLASHPDLSFLNARTALLIHVLLGNAALVMTPFTKIAHCVLYPFTQLVFELGWHFPAESGRHVAVVLAKENEPV